LTDEYILNEVAVIGPLEHLATR